MAAPCNYIIGELEEIDKNYRKQNRGQQDRRRIRGEMDAEKHIKEGKRLEQALGDKFASIQQEMKETFVKNSIDAMPELSLDVCRYVIEEMYLERLII